MKQQKLLQLRGILTCIAGLVLMMLLISACAGVSGTTGTGNSVSITGTVQSIDTANDTVTLSVQGQALTIKGLNATQLSAIQSQVGKVYTITATQNSDGTYTITTGTTPINDNNSQGVTQGVVTVTTDSGTPDTNEPGSIAFIGKVQSVTNSSIVVALPNGQNLSMSIVNGQTDMSDFNGSLPTVGQLINVEASTNTDGTFMATKLSTTDSGDLQNQNLVTYQGLTTSAVGTDNVLHMKVGNQSLTFTISSSADLGDFNNNAQSITSNLSVKVDVLYQGSTSVVQKVGN
jgi:Domain of unknown function (DUF5666)